MGQRRIALLIDSSQQPASSSWGATGADGHAEEAGEEDGEGSAAKQRISELEVEVKRLKNRVKLEEQRNRLLHNQQQLLLDITARIAEAKRHYEHHAHELRGFLFDRVVEGQGRKERQGSASTSASTQ